MTVKQEMATHTLALFTVITLLAIICEVRAAPDKKPIKALANLTSEELVYILKTRHGVSVVKPKHMTPCARAILGCCSNKKINEYCSESLQCGAYFFDDNPCDDKFLEDALKDARYFYEQFEKVTT